MLRKLTAAAAVIAAGVLAGCGTSTTGPDGGIKQQTMTGVSASGYPKGEPKDVYSPALGSSTEQKYSRDGNHMPGDPEEKPEHGEQKK